MCEGTPLDDVCPLYRVETLWPVIISQVGMLRAAMGFVPTSRHDQALVFALEALVESALQEALPHQAEQCLDLMARIGVDAEHADRRLNSRGRYFIETAPRDRLRALPMLLESMLPMYDILAPVWERSGVPGVIPLAVLDACDRKEDWPQFEW